MRNIFHKLMEKILKIKRMGVVNFENEKDKLKT